MITQTTKNVALNYHEFVQQLLARIIDTQMEKIDQAAGHVADTVERNGIVYTLGSGHSLTVAAELYDRAGGLANCDVIWDRTFGRAERLPGYARVLLESYPVEPTDLLIIVSNSGRNPLPVEMAIEARQRGIFTIGITSLTHSRAVSSRAEQGVRLFEVCRLVIDTCGELGDAAIPVDPGKPIRVGPTSTLAGVFIANCIAGLAARKLLDRGIDPPIYLSANLDGSDEINAKLVEYQRKHIRGL